MFLLIKINTISKHSELILIFFVFFMAAVFHASAISNCSTTDYKHRTVSEGGSDSPACLDDKGPPCGSLEYALGHDDNCLSVQINSSLNVTAAIHVSGSSGLVVSGDGTQTLFCEDGAGMYFENNNNTVIEGLSLVECSADHPSGVLSPSLDLFYPNISSAMFFHRCVNISIRNCSFTSNLGSGVAIFNSGGLVTISESNFVNNSNPTMNCSDSEGRGCYNVSVGLEIKMTYCELDTNCTTPQQESVYNSDSVYVIEDCMFSGNNNSFSTTTTQSEAILSYTAHRTVSHGGGMEVRLEGVASRNSFEIKASRFEGNRALWGGGLEVGIGEMCSNNSVQVIYCNFSSNIALVGGAVHMAVFPPIPYDGFGQEEKQNIFTIKESRFENNSAVSAGALSYQSNTQLTKSELSHLQVNNTLFVNNHANNSAAAVAVSGWVFELGGFPSYAEFENCSFTGNSIGFRVDITTVYGVGVVNTEHIPIIFRGHTTFQNNSGSSLIVSSASVFLHGTVMFQRNWGLNGAGILLVGLSWIELNPGVQMFFQDNKAFLYGGAIYSTFSLPQIHNSSRYCILRYSNSSNNVSEWNATMYFSNNYARLSGNSIFVSSGAGCYKSNETGLPFTDPNVFIYETNTGNYSTEIGTLPAKISFGSPAISNGSFFDTSIMLGQPFQLHPVSEDEFGNPTSSSALVSLICNPNDDACDKKTFTSEYSLIGNTLVQLNNSEKVSSFSIVGGPNITQNSPIILLLSNSMPSAMGYLHVNVTECILGYTYNNQNGACECIENEIISCGDGDDNEACIKYGYWVGKDTSQQPVIELCDYYSCNYDNGKCPFDKCNRALQSYCELPKYDSDKLCKDNRGGLLCGSCRDGYTFTFDALQCVPNHTCSAGNTILLLFLNIIFMVILMVILLFAIAVGMQLGSGHLYCLIYYFSVLQYLTRNNYPSEFLNIVVYLFSGFLNVTPDFLGLIPLCYLNTTSSPLTLTFMEYMHPLIMLLGIIVLIIVTRKFPRIGNKISFNGSRALCILLYLSLTSLAEASLGMLSFTRIGETTQSTRVSIQPTTVYFSPTDHLPYALVAIAVLLFIVFPFIFVLLFAPCLARVPRINMTRIKPILDEYQACYHEKYRWFAGFYPACRVSVFLFSLINFGEFGSIFFLQMISIAILLVHSIFQPYRKQWLNVLDSILLADLAIYSLFNGSTANVVLGQYSTVLRLLLIHILILFPVFYFFIISFYDFNSIFKVTQILYALYTRRKGFDLNNSTITHQVDLNSDNPENGTKETSTDKEREPLIYSQSDHTTPHGRPESVKRERISSRPLFRSLSRIWSPTSPRAISSPPVIRELTTSTDIVDVYKNSMFTKTVISPPK